MQLFFQAQVVAVLGLVLRADDSHRHGVGGPRGGSSVREPPLWTLPDTLGKRARQHRSGVRVYRRLGGGTCSNHEIHSCSIRKRPDIDPDMAIEFILLDTLLLLITRQMP